jgi:hypothetical protein
LLLSLWPIRYLLIFKNTIESSLHFSLWPRFLHFLLYTSWNSWS